MKLKTDTIGHFDNPTENNIRDAVMYAGEGAREVDIVKLMIDDQHFLNIWIGKRSKGHLLILRTGPWKAECTEKLSSEKSVDLLISYLNNDLSKLNQLQWTRPFDIVFTDHLEKL